MPETRLPIRSSCSSERPQRRQGIMFLLELTLLSALWVLLRFANGYEIPLRADDSCSHPSLSCPSHLPSPVDSCCLNHPSGHFLLTQFWDAKPALGASDSWTIHGLWPDFCAGGFDQFCDTSRSYFNISDILEATASSSDLLTFMNGNWLSLNHNNDHLWAHEWNKHGTCISTLEPNCYSDDSTKFDAVLDYFNRATNLYSTLDTYQTLADHLILPSHHKTYTLSALQDAVSPSHDDYEVTFRCYGHELQEIWYHYYVRGSLRGAPAFNSSVSSADMRQAVRQIFVPTGPDVAKTNCPPYGIKYLPKEPTNPSPTSAPATGTTVNPSPTPTSTTPFSGRGHLLIRVTNANSSATLSPSAESEYTGCLIRGGKWYRTSGSSCATYIAKEDVKHPFDTDDVDNANDDEESDHLFTLSSLYSPCAVMPLSTAKDAGLFTCAKDLGIQSIFSYKNISAPGSASNPSPASKRWRIVLAHLDRTTFYASKIPEKFEKAQLYVTDGNGEGDEDQKRQVEVEIEWQGV